MQNNKKWFTIFIASQLIFELVLPFSRNGYSSSLHTLINETVWAPIPDGVNLTLPRSLKKSPIAKLGFIDVTAPPFLADPTGKNDSTQALQKAIDFARDHQLVCFFPPGRYLVSNTLQCIQNNYRRTNGKIVGGRNFPCVLLGSSRSKKRPQIILRPYASGFQDPIHPKYLIHFWARQIGNPSRPQPNISMNQMLIGLDLIIGKHNPGAVAIRMRGAQGCGVEDCFIDARHGMTGVEGGVGSGGSFVNITVLGGKIGLDLRQTQPVPTLVGITLLDQTYRAILYEGRQTLCAVGLKIIYPGNGPAIQTLPGHRLPGRSQLSLIDSTIDCISKRAQGIAAAKSVFLGNVYLKNVNTAVAGPEGQLLVPGNPNGWIRIKQFAHGVRPKRWKGLQYEAPIYLEGKKVEGDLLEVQLGKIPPKTLQEKHLWPGKFPCWECATVVNVKKNPYKAKGDGQSDDTQALQSALDEHEIIFLPKGYYRVSKTLRMHSKNKIIGVGRHLSIIMAAPDSAIFKDDQHPCPVLRSSSNKEAANVIALCGVYVPKIARGAYALEWQCGVDSILRDVNFITQPVRGYIAPGYMKPVNIPLVAISANGAGKWYNFFQDSCRAQGELYRHLIIKNTNGPLNIYQCNPEHSQGTANMDIRHAKNISVFGLKSEGNHCVLTISNSNRINIFGYGGNAAAMPGQALFKINKSSNLLIVNAVDAPRLQNEVSNNIGIGMGTDPRKWFMIIDKTRQGLNYKTRPLERPVLYKRVN